MIDFNVTWHAQKKDSKCQFFLLFLQTHKTNPNVTQNLKQIEFKAILMKTIKKKSQPTESIYFAFRAHLMFCFIFCTNSEQAIKKQGLFSLITSSFLLAAVPTYRISESLFYAGTDLLRKKIDLPYPSPPLVGPTWCWAQMLLCHSCPHPPHFISTKSSTHLSEKN